MWIFRENIGIKNIIPNKGKKNNVFPKHTYIIQEDEFDIFIIF